MKSREKNTNKGYNRIKYSNGLEITVSSTCTVSMGIFLVDMSGDTAKIAQRVGPIGAGTCWIWDINDVFNDSTTQEVNWHRRATRG